MTLPGLQQALMQSRVVVCAGTGGVGKTTIAASLALQAALLGRRTLVLTIDPARRLADALGLPEIGSRPTVVDPTKFGGDAAGDGSLEAMMLDPKPTFDRLITSLASDPAARERILGNRIYRHLSEALAGSAEYAAMEQVHELVESKHYDLIVVDTPPADHALDFLRAPRRLREFLESRFVHTLVRPAMSASRLGVRFFGRGLQRMLGLLERIAGVGFLDDLSEFLSAIDGLSEGFRERAQHVEEVLLGEETGFVLVTAAQAGSNSGTLEFMSELDGFHVRLIAIVANRLRPWPLEASPSDCLERWQGGALARDEARLAAALAQTDSKAEAQTSPEDITEALRQHAQIRLAGEAQLDALAAHAAQKQVRCHAVSELGGDVDRIEGLLEIGRILTQPQASPVLVGLA
ncbi:MAG: hypothetical protein CL908_19110 [Deltaproteobacteria bacterium]|nr:hypothetical protein [Deltaproteobacteria bacterium]